MNDKDRLAEMLSNSKEDAPVAVSMFKEFLYNHFNHLKWQVSQIRWLTLTILAALIAIIVMRALG